MADSKFISLTGLNTFLEQLETEVDGKVDKVGGKGLSTNDFTTAEKQKLAGIAEGANKTTVDSALSAGSANPVQNKAVKAELDKKLNSSEKGSAGGVAELGADGKILSSQLPGSVDEIIEGYLNAGKFYRESGHTTQITGEASKMYVDLTTNKTYRWSSTAFVEVSASIALGETSATAYRGDRGKIAYEHSQAAHAPTTAATQTAIGLMSAEDKKKLDGIATGATKITVDSALNGTSTNPVQNKVINTALAGKSATNHGHNAATASAAGFMSAADKNKLDGLVEATEAEILALFN